MHDHNFDAKDWPFSFRADEIAYSSKRVVRDGHPILVVSHDTYGEWQLLHGELTDDDEMAQICFGCAYESDRTLSEVASLERNCIAEREKVGGEWKIESLGPSDDPIWVRLMWHSISFFRRLRRRIG